MIIAKLIPAVLSLKRFLREKIIAQWPYFLLVLFFFLRLYNLGFHDFWHDEISTVNFVYYPRANWNTPLYSLYWVFLHFWVKLFGLSEFILRFPSAIFSFFSVILTYFLGKILFDKKVGIIASIFMGLSPFHLWYAQEARDYSMALFFCLLSSCLFLKAIKSNGFKHWFFYALVTLGALYTNYFTIFIFLAQSVYLVYLRRIRFNLKEVISLLIIVIGFSFYLPYFLKKFNFVEGGFWLNKPTWQSLVITLENFILGYNGDSSLYLISGILCGVFLIKAIYCLKNENIRDSLIFCILLSIIPVILIFLFSKIAFSIYLDRALIIFSPGYYFILALGIAHLKKKFIIILLPIMAMLLIIADCRYFKDQIFAPLEHHMGAYLKKPIKPITEFLDNNLGPEDIIGRTNRSAFSAIEFYSKTRIHFLYFFDPKLPDTDLKRPIKDDRFCIPFEKIGQLKFRRLYLLASNWHRDGGLDENSLSVKNWLDNNLKLKYSQNFDGLWVYIYEL